MIVVFENVIRVTFVVSNTMVTLRSDGTTTRRIFCDPNSLHGTNEYWSGPMS
jgi:hypothetical protein